MRSTGIDIASNVVRFVELETTAEGVRLRSCGSVPTPLFGDDVEDPAGAADEANDLLDRFHSAGVHWPRGIVGVSGRDLMLRYFRVGDVAAARQQTMIRMEIADMTGEGADDVASDYIKLPRIDDAGEHTVMVALARHDWLERNWTGLRRLHVRPSRLTPSSLGLYNAWLLSGEINDDETVLLASIGYTGAELCVIQGATLLFARTLNNGGKDFADVVAEHHSLPAFRAWKGLLAKADMTPPGPGQRDGGQVQVGLWSVGDQFFRMLESSVNFAKLQLGKRRLKADRVLLCGDLVRLTGFVEFMGSRFKVPVERFDPLDRVEVGELPEVCRTGESNPKKLPHQYAVAAGLAQIGLHPDPVSVSLEPPSVVAKREFLHRSAFLYGGALAAVLLVVLMLVGAGSYSEAAQDARKKAESAQRGVDRMMERYAGRKAAWEESQPLLHSARAAMRPTAQFLQVQAALREFGTEHDELIVEQIELEPPHEEEIRSPHRVHLSFYFEEKGGPEPTELIIALIDHLRTGCGDAIVADSLEEYDSARLDQNSPLGSGMHFRMTITLAPHD